jgi:murein L,D-transpeptidase YafK
MKLKKILIVAALALTAFLIWNYNPPSAPEENADRVIVYKSERELQLLKKNKVIFECKISLGENPIGHKIQEGDERTPEGNYFLDWRKRSAFHKAIHISYPNQRDIAAAKSKGISPGGSIMIHGLKNDWAWIGKIHLFDDWTNGCIAVTNQEMDIIWRHVENGTPIEIRK